MRCATKCLFKILVTASSDKPTPELYFLPGRLRWTLFPKSATAIHSVAVDRTLIPPIKADWPSPPQRKVRCQCLGRVSGDVMMCSWGVGKESTIGEQELSYPWLFAVISCRAFLIRFSEEGQYKPRNTSSVMFDNLQSNVISFLCSKAFWLGWRK